MARFNRQHRGPLTLIPRRTTSAGATNAPAEAAAGTGTAYDATVAIGPAAGVATGTGTAPNPVGQVGAQAEGAIASGSRFEDDFTELAPIGHVDGDNFGRWTAQFDEANPANIIPVDVSGTRYLRVQSDSVGSGPETVAALATTQESFTTWSTLAVEYITDTQWRTPTPNNWEVAWVFLNYTNNNSFYYVLLCPDGYWELGKEWHDGVIQRQDFLAYGVAPVTWPIGDRLRVEVDQTISGSSVTYTFRAKDITRGDASYQTLVSNFTDDGSRESGAAYLFGSVGLYVEDSSARFALVELDKSRTIDASPVVAATPTAATGAGTALDPSVAASPAAGTATATGVANDATASTGGTWTWNAEGGVDQATIATSDTGSGQPWDTVVVGTGATVKYEASAPLFGALSMYVDVSATSASAYTQWLLSAARATGYTGFAFRYASTFGGSCSIWSANSGSTARVRLQITGADKLRVLNAAGGTAWTSTTTMTPGASYFTSVDFTADVAGSVTVRLYDATGALLEDSGAISADYGGTFDRVRFGSVANQTNTNWRPVRYDEISFSTNSAVTAPVSPAAGSATGTGAAFDAQTAVTANADVATATGTAFDATVVTSSSTSAPADVAAGTAAAFDAGVTLMVTSGSADGVGTATDAVAAAGASPAEAAGTGTAFAATTDVTATSGASSGTGTAGDGSAVLTATADTAAATGQAHDGSAAAAANASTATGTGTAFDATVAVGVAAEAPTGSAVAYDPATAVTVNADTATAAGSAYDASVTTVNSVNANAEAASGTGTAFDATVSIGVDADAASGAGLALDATTTVTVTAGTSTATGSADHATAAVDATTAAATGAGSAHDPLATLAALIDAAFASGTAFDASIPSQAAGRGRATLVRQSAAPVVRTYGTPVRR